MKFRKNSRVRWSSNRARSRFAGWLLAAAAVASAGSFWAQGADPPALSASEKSTLERVALARARAALQRQVLALPIRDDLTLAAWGSQDYALDRELRAWLRSRPRLFQPRFFSDGVCEVDARVSAAELREKLLELLAQRGKEGVERKGAAGVTDRDIREAARRWNVQYATGTAALAERDAGQKRPLGWEDVTFDGVQIAASAAAADARECLLRAAAKLKVTNAHLVGEFLESGDAVREAVLAALQKAAGVKVRHEPDQVAVAEATVSISDLIRILSDAHASAYRGDVFHAADFREMALINRPGDLSAEGAAGPPASQILRSPYEPIELDAPGWVGETLTVEASYLPLDEDGTYGDDVRVELARVEAMDALRRRIEKLVIQRDVTVEQFLGFHPRLKGDVVTFLTAARPVFFIARGDGTATVRAELPLRRLWEIVKLGMRVEEVDPP